MTYTNDTMITAAFAQQFAHTFELNTEQRQSRLQATVTNIGKVVGASFTINDLGSFEMSERPRFGDTEIDIPEAGTRIVNMRDFQKATMVEKMDIPKLVANVQGAYMANLVSAYHRQVDKVIMSALLGAIPRKTENGGALTDTALPNTQKIVHSSVGLTKAKILAAKSLFRKNECDEVDGEKLYILYNADMMTSILSDTTFTSADYMAVQMLQEGSVSHNWMGVTWVPYEGLPLSTDSAYRSAVMYTGTAVHFGQGSNLDVDISRRKDKNNNIQLYIDASMGAGRANEKKVVEIQVAA